MTITKANSFKAVLCLIFAFFLSLAVIGQCLAFVAPQIYCGELKMDRLSYAAGDRLTAALDLQNFDNAFYGDLIFDFSIVQNSPTGTKVIDERAGDAFSLNPLEKRTMSISYWLPAKLPTGRFVFRIELKNIHGSTIAWSDQEIDIKGEGPFASIGYDRPSGEDFSPTVILEAATKPTVKFNLENQADFNGGASIAKIFRLITADENGKIIGQSDYQAHLSAPNPTHMEYNLPAFFRPGRYRTIVRVFSRGTGDAVSNILVYNWIVKGSPGLSEVTYANRDKAGYVRNDKAMLFVWLIFPYWDGTSNSVDIDASFLDSKNQTAAHATKTVAVADGITSVELPVVSAIDNPKVSIKVYSGGSILDSYEFLAPVEDQTAKPEKKNPVTPDNDLFAAFDAQLKANLFLGLFLVSLGAALVVAIVFYKKRYIKPKSKKTTGFAGDKKGEQSMEDLLREFNEIDRLNKRFKQ